MPNYLVKCDPDQDFYVVWSDIVDAPNVWGERAEVEGCRWLEPREVAAERFHRADEYGTSAQWGADGPGMTIVRPYAWDSDGFVYDQGFLPRARLRELCERLEKGPADVTDLLEPIEDAAPTGTRERLATSSDVPDPVLTGGLDTSLEPIDVTETDGTMSETTTTTTISDFLLARIAEDEALAVAAGARDPDFEDWDDWPSYPWGISEQEYALQHVYNPARVLAECEAKRTIVEGFVQARQLADSLPGVDTVAVLAFSAANAFLVVLHALAAVYADHPDYQQEWRL